VLIRIDPQNPASTTDFVCDLCTAMPQPTDDGRTTPQDPRRGQVPRRQPADRVRRRASWQEIVSPPPGKTARASLLRHGRQDRSADAATIVFRLKFNTAAFLPALADPFAWIYRKEILDATPLVRKDIMAPARSSSSVRGRTVDQGHAQPDYYHRAAAPGRFVGIFAPKLATRIDAVRADRAAMEFRSMPPSARDQLVKELGDQVAVQDSDWNCGNLLTTTTSASRSAMCGARALSLAIDQWKGVRPCRRSPSSRPSPASCFPARRSPRPRRNCRRSPGSGGYREIAGRGARLLKEAGADGSASSCSTAMSTSRSNMSHLRRRRVEQGRAQVTQKVVPTAVVENMRGAPST